MLYFCIGLNIGILISLLAKRTPLRDSYKDAASEQIQISLLKKENDQLYERNIFMNKQIQVLKGLTPEDIKEQKILQREQRNKEAAEVFNDGF